MWQHEDEYIVRCGCSDLSHFCHLVFDKDKYEDFNFATLYIHLAIITCPLIQRIKKAILYVFKERKFWHYGDVLIELNNPEGQQELKGLIEFLQKGLIK